MPWNDWHCIHVSINMWPDLHHYDWEQVHQMLSVNTKDLSQHWLFSNINLPIGLLVQQRLSVVFIELVSKCRIVVDSFNINQSLTLDIWYKVKSS